MQIKCTNWYLPYASDKSGDSPCVYVVARNKEFELVTVKFPFEYTISVVEEAMKSICSVYRRVYTKAYTVNHSIDRKLPPDTVLYKLYITTARDYYSIITLCNTYNYVIYDSITRPISSFFYETGIDPSGTLSLPDEYLTTDADMLISMRADIKTPANLSVAKHHFLFEVQYRQLRDVVSPAPSFISYLSVLTYDVEALITRSDVIPNPLDAPACILSISIDFVDNRGNSTVYLLALDYKGVLQKRYNSTDSVTYVDIPNSDISIVFKEEVDMLLYFIDLVRKLSPDVLSGFNLEFDIKYIRDRCIILGRKSAFNTLSLFPRHDVVIREKENESKNTVDFTCEIPGIIVFDTYVHMIRNEKLREYNLNYTSIVSYKQDVTASCTVDKDGRALTLFHINSKDGTIEKAFRQTTWVIVFVYTDGKRQTDTGVKYPVKSMHVSCPCCGLKHVTIGIDAPDIDINTQCSISLCKDDIDLHKVCNGLNRYETITNKDEVDQLYYDMLVYNIQDSKLSKNLYDKYNINTLIQADSTLTKLPQYTMQIYRNTTKTLAIMQETAFELGIALRDCSTSTSKHTKYRGGIVYDINKNIFSNPVGVVDFEGLYPSVSKTYELSPDTLYDVIKFRTPWEFPDLTLYPEDKYTLVFGRDADKIDSPEYYLMIFTKTLGLIPEVLKKTTKMRAFHKQIMKTAEFGSSEYIFAYNMQMLLKITSNSIYGLLAANYYKLYSPDVAKAIASKARAANKELHLWIESAPYAHKTGDGWTFNNDKADAYYMLVCVYGDTDSQFIEYVWQRSNSNTVNLHELFEVGRSLEKTYNEEIGKGLIIEFEKVLYPLIMFSKKQYCATGYTSPTCIKDIEQGTTFVRRDKMEVQKQIYKICKQITQSYCIDHKDEQRHSIELSDAIYTYIREKFGITGVINPSMFTKFTSYSGFYKKEHFLYEAIQAYNTANPSQQLVKGSRFKYMLIAATTTKYDKNNTVKVGRFATITTDDILPPNTRMLLEYCLMSCEKVFSKFFVSSMKFKCDELYTKLNTEIREFTESNIAGY